MKMKLIEQSPDRNVCVYSGFSELKCIEIQAPY